MIYTKYFSVVKVRMGRLRVYYPVVCLPVLYADLWWRTVGGRVKRNYHKKYEKLNQRRFDDGPASAPLPQHQTNIGSACNVDWELTAVLMQMAWQTKWSDPSGQAIKSMATILPDCLFQVNNSDATVGWSTEQSKLALLWCAVPPSTHINNTPLILGSHSYHHNIRDSL